MIRRCFTVVELIVVIATIAVLAAILLPMLRSSRAQAKATVCGSNIRQLVAILSVYEADNGVYPFGLDTNPFLEPPPWGYAGKHGFDRMGWWWFDFIEDYNRESPRQKELLQCPAKCLRDSRLKDNLLCGNYGANLSICKSSFGRRTQAEFVGNPLRAVDIRHAAQTLLVVDSGYAIINWWHAADVPPVTLSNIMIEDTAYVPGLSINHERQLRSGQMLDACSGRHSQMTVNVGFVDGHVTRTKAEDLLVKRGADGNYENRSPLWVPDSR